MLRNVSKGEKSSGGLHKKDADHTNILSLLLEKKVDAKTALSHMAKTHIDPSAIMSKEKKDPTDLKVEPMTKKIEVNAYDELIRSLPENERSSVIAELDSSEIVSRAELLCKELDANEFVGLDLGGSRTLFLAALRNLKLEKITVAQLATLHILDSAIRTLYVNPCMYLIHHFVAENEVNRTTSPFVLTNTKGLPTKVLRLPFDSMGVATNTSISDLPHRMQKPLMARFFNFTEAEWKNFCEEMVNVSSAEQGFKVLVAPAAGCYSGIISQIQRILKCMHTIDWARDVEDGYAVENIMIVPSLSMFQAALNAKAKTLNRTPVELIPTYGYIEPIRYAELKAAGKIALAMYMPEESPSLRYNSDYGRFRTTIDGHPCETAFAGAIHDVYHAMREMVMSENVAKARMRLVSIAKKHPNNRRTPSSRPVDDILIDGELIHSYPPEQDTMFNPEYRPLRAQMFGDIFYTPALRGHLHDNLKRDFIEDMVVNETLWKTEFNIGKSDLRETEQKIFDEIKSQRAPANPVVSLSEAKTMAQIGLLPSPALKSASAASPPSLVLGGQRIAVMGGRKRTRVA